MSLLVALWLPLVSIGSSATAQPAQDPYRGTTTTAAASFDEACILSAPGGEPGESITAEVSGVAVGTSVEIRFEGQPVGNGMAEPDGGDEATGTALITFVVPAVANGSYAVVAVGLTFNESCGDGFAVSNSEVLSGGTGNQGGQRSGLLPRTGVELALWLAIAAAMVLIGRALMKAARRRRARARRLEARRQRAEAGV